MKTPQFWHKRTITSYLLWPLSCLYLLLSLIRRLITVPKKIPIPIICIGNLTAGGAGKTQVAIEIGLMLKKMNIDFAYLSRGYKGSATEFTEVNRNSNSSVTGDEPLLLSEIAPTFVAKDRLSGASKIAAMPDKQLIIMDDGMQNPSLIKDLSILVIDGGYGFGNGLVMPAGPLRECIKPGIARADLIIIIGEDKFNIAGLCVGKKIIFAKIKNKNGEQFSGSKAVAFCGIGRPSKFFDSLLGTGADIIQKIEYADHHFYSESDLQYLLNLAEKNNAILITTKKDWVRLEENYRRQIQYLDIKIEFDDANYLQEKISNLC